MTNEQPIDLELNHIVIKKETCIGTYISAASRATALRRKGIDPFDEFSDRPRKFALLHNLGTARCSSDIEPGIDSCGSAPCRNYGKWNGFYSRDDTQNGKSHYLHHHSGTRDLASLLPRKSSLLPTPPSPWSTDK